MTRIEIMIDEIDAAVDEKNARVLPNGDGSYDIEVREAGEWCPIVRGLATLDQVAEQIERM